MQPTTNNNTYTTWSDNEWNWFRWGEWKASPERNRMFDFVKKTIQMRKDYKHVFAPTEYFAPPFAYKSEFNSDDVNWNGRAIMQHYYDSSIGPQVVVLYNMHRGPVNFTLPEGVDWYRLLDTQRYFDDVEFLETQGDDLVSYNVGMGDAPVGGSYEVPGSTIVVLVEQQ